MTTGSSVGGVPLNTPAPPTAVRLTAAQARRLGVDTPAKPRTSRRVAKGAPYHTRCVACDAEFTTQAAEDRHVATGHHRYELVLT